MLCLTGFAYQVFVYDLEMDETRLSDPAVTKTISVSKVTVGTAGRNRVDEIYI